MENLIKELTEYLKVIEDFDKDSAQDGSVLHEYLIHLSNMQARSNFIMADYKRKVRQEKIKAYDKIVTEYHVQQKYYAPSLAKDYADAKCADIAFVYDLAERLSRSCTHTQDGIRTIISSLKAERQFANF